VWRRGCQILTAAAPCRCGLAVLLSTCALGKMRMRSFWSQHFYSAESIKNRMMDFVVVELCGISIDLMAFRPAFILKVSRQKKVTENGGDREHPRRKLLITRSHCHTFQWAGNTQYGKTECGIEVQQNSGCHWRPTSALRNGKRIQETLMSCACRSRRHRLLRERRATDIRNYQEEEAGN
jgi:hypothetical protein